MGPFELMDLIGHDVNLAVTKSVFEAFYWDPRFLPSLIQEDLVAAGRLGRKSGRGFYDHSQDAQSPIPNTAADANPPGAAIFPKQSGILSPLKQMAAAAGIKVEEVDDVDPMVFTVDGVCLALSDGMTATETARNAEFDEVVVFDLALDYETATRIAIARADQATGKSAETVTGFFQALGKSVSVIDDVPGLVVMRTVAMLANEGADAVHMGVCDAAAVDTAMCNGVNYPLGPLAWAERVGLDHIEAVMQNLADVYGGGRYRCCPLIARKVAGGGSFF